MSRSRMIRQFVNLVAENYETGVYSLHRLDVSKHLFHESRADARVVTFRASQAHANACDEQPMLDRLKELPSAMTTWSSSNVDHFTLLEGKILCLNKFGTAVLYDPDSSSNFIMPRLKNFKGGPVHLSVTVAPAGDKQERLYIMQGGPDGLDLNVLRYGPLSRLCTDKVWYWQSLPLPPFVDDNPQYKCEPAIISSYTAVDGGNTICLSSVAEGVGIETCYLNAVTCEWKHADDWVMPFTGKAEFISACEWKHAGDWVMPFTGKAEFISGLNLWLGFSLHSPGFLCAASDLSDMRMDKIPMSLIAWPDHTTPKESMTVMFAKLISLGSGKLAVVKVFKDTAEDEIVVVSGVELEFRGKDNNHDLRGLKLLQHKSISYTCAKNSATAIRYVP